jgi:hypothetical protein
LEEETNMVATVVTEEAQREANMETPLLSISKKDSMKEETQESMVEAEETQH